MMSGPAGTVITVVFVAMVLVVGLIAFSSFESNIDHSEISTTASTAINKTTAQTYSGFNLGSVMPLILFAVAIIGIIAYAFGRGR